MCVTSDRWSFISACERTFVFTCDTFTARRSRKSKATHRWYCEERASQVQPLTLLCLLFGGMGVALVIIGIA